MTRRNRPLLTDTASRYGLLTRGWHWAIALAVLAAVPLGLIARYRAAGLNQAEGPALGDLIDQTAAAFSWHKSLGLIVLALALLWLLFTSPSRRRPDLIHGQNRGAALLARSTQSVLRLALLALPLTGWLIHSASTGFAPHLLPLPQRLPLVPQEAGLAALATGLHRGALVLTGLALVLHIAGALWHHFHHRDATLTRMALGRDAPGSAVQPGPRAPRLIALVLWAGALALGGLIGAAPPPAPPQGQILGAGGWQVQKGQLTLSVTQFGKEISGQFSTWSARIDWDERSGLGPAGQVRIRVDLASLSLGPLTTQALGPDFFAIRSHPTAAFDASLIRILDGQQAEGTLSLRGQTQPLSFPFRLTIADGIAYASGEMIIDRRDFGIGANLPDPATLAHQVTLRFSLEARRVD